MNCKTTRKSHMSGRAPVFRCFSGPDFPRLVVPIKSVIKSKKGRAGLWTLADQRAAIVRWTDERSPRRSDRGESARPDQANGARGLPRCCAGTPRRLIQSHPCPRLPILLRRVERYDIWLAPNVRPRQHRRVWAILGMSSDQTSVRREPGFSDTSRVHPRHWRVGYYGGDAPPGECARRA